MEIFWGIDVPLWALLLPVLLILIYRYLTSTYDTWSNQGIPGPKPSLVFGNTLQGLAFGNFVYADESHVKKYGKFTGMYQGRQPSLICSDPEFIRKALIKEFNSMPNRRQVDIGSSGNLLLTALNDDHWRHVRSSISPTFTTGKLKQMKTLIEMSVETLIEKFRTLNSTPFDPKIVFGCYATDVICSTAFGIQLNSHTDQENLTVKYASVVFNNRRTGSRWATLKIIIAGLSLLLLPMKVSKIMTWLGFTVLDAEAMDYFSRMTDSILGDRRAGDSASKDFVQLCRDQLIDQPRKGDPDAMVDDKGIVWSPNGLTRDEIVGNAIIFLLAGYDTTATTLGYVAYELAMNPEVQEKLYEEIQEHLNSAEPSYEEAMKLEYLDWVIDETLRLYPPAPRLERAVIRDTEIDGVKMPKGTLFSAAVYAVHHDPEIWPEPSKFDPERFSPENKDGRHSCAWLPFGAGNRNCIGMRLARLEMKLALIAIVREFKLETCNSTPERPIKFAKDFQLHPEAPLMLVANKRN